MIWYKNEDCNNTCTDDKPYALMVTFHYGNCENPCYDEYLHSLSIYDRDSKSILVGLYETPIFFDSGYYGIPEHYNYSLYENKL